MNLFNTLASLVVVGYAQTATLRSYDAFGEIVDEDSVQVGSDFTFTTSIELKRSKLLLSEIELTVADYAVN